jgi:hypothetical protein
MRAAMGNHLSTIKLLKEDFKANLTVQSNVS